MRCGVTPVAATRWSTASAREQSRASKAARAKSSRVVDVVRPLGRDRDLVDVEVELLLARRVGGVERLLDPDDVVLREAQLLGDGVGDRRLEALAVAGVVLGEPRFVRRGVGADGQLAVLLQRQVGGLAGGRRAAPGAGLALASAGGQRGGESERSDDKGSKASAHVRNGKWNAHWPLLITHE